MSSGIHLVSASFILFSQCIFSSPEIDGAVMLSFQETFFVFIVSELTLEATESILC